MPAGRPPKPVRLHQLQGTYRADRHGQARRFEDRLQLVRRAPERCALCGRTFEEDEPMASNAAETAAICNGCAGGALRVFEQIGYEMIDDDILAGYVDDEGRLIPKD